MSNVLSKVLLEAVFVPRVAFCVSVLNCLHELSNLSCVFFF